MKNLGTTVFVHGRPLYDGYWYRQDGTEGYVVRIERRGRRWIGRYYEQSGDRVRSTGSWMTLSYEGVWSLHPLTIKQNEKMEVVK